jgi:Xaa-Pro aminopeptidase
MTQQYYKNIPTYSQAEKERRWGIANQIMEDEELDALVIYGDREGAFPASYAPDTYFTNERPGSIVIFPKNGEPISVAFLLTVIQDHIQANFGRSNGWIKAENMYTGKMGSNVVEILEDKGLDKSSIGTIGLEPYPPFYFDGPMPYNTWQAMIEDMPEAKFRQVDSKFFELTSVKSEEELAVLKWSADVGEKMSRAMADATKAGVRENEIYAAAIAACAQNVGFTTELLMGSGPEFIGWGPPTWTYRPEEPRIIEDGDVVLAEVFSSFGMLETQHQPTIAVGKVHPDFDKAAAIARKSYEAGIKTLRDGIKFGEVVEAMRKPLREVEDAWSVHPLIHSMNPFGLIGTGDRMGSLPEFKNYGKVLLIPGVGLDTVLKKGMTFAFEPNVALGKRVVNIGGTVVVGENNGIELNELTNNIIKV